MVARPILVDRWNGAQAIVERHIIVERQDGVDRHKKRIRIRPGTGDEKFQDLIMQNGGNGVAFGMVSGIDDALFSKKKFRSEDIVSIRQIYFEDPFTDVGIARVLGVRLIVTDPAPA